jgi:hypothetical protein
MDFIMVEKIDAVPGAGEKRQAKAANPLETGF